jgi:saccharopine dehydrogenase (NAD+, L-lysine-forming)
LVASKVYVLIQIMNLILLEQEVMKLIHETHAEDIQKASILAICGVGFDIVPTDCLAAKLAAALPTATHLELAFGSKTMHPSSGTALTSVEAMCQGTPLCARVNGKMTPVGIGYKSRTVTFPTLGESFVSFIPWGDCYSAYFSTSIPNIDVYIPGNKIMSTISYYTAPVLSASLQYLPFLGRTVKSILPKIIPGPSAETQEMGTMDVWGEVRNDSTGEKACGTLIVPEGYVFTARAALESAKRVFHGKVNQKAGSVTPSKVFGSDFVQTIEGVVVQDIQKCDK